MIRTPPTRLATHVVLALTWAIALVLLVKGHAETGDGFSAGLTAGTGLAIHALVFGREETRRLAVVRHAQRIAGVGLLLVLTPVVAPLLAGHAPLTHVPDAGSHAPTFGTLELHSGFVLDTGLFLLVLGLIAAGIVALAEAAAVLREDVS